MWQSILAITNYRTLPPAYDGEAILPDAESLLQNVRETLLGFNSQEAPEPFSAMCSENVQNKCLIFHRPLQYLSEHQCHTTMLQSHCCVVPASPTIVPSHSYPSSWSASMGLSWGTSKSQQPHWLDPLQFVYCPVPVYLQGFYGAHASMGQSCFVYERETLLMMKY